MSDAYFSRQAQELPDELDILPLFGTVVYPQVVVPLAVSQPASIRLLDAPTGGSRIIGMVAQRAEGQRPDPVQPEHCYRVGTVVLVHRLLRLPDETLRVAVEGVERFEVVRFVPDRDHLRASVRRLPEAPVEADAALIALMHNLVRQAQQLARIIPNFSQELLAQIHDEEDPVRLAYLLASAALLRRSVDERQQILELADVTVRLERISAMLTVDLQLLQAGRLAPHAESQPTDAHTTTVPLEPQPPLRSQDVVSAAYCYADRPGRVLWLRWTATGAECTAVEVVRMAGSKQFFLTGHNDAVLRDAAHVALSWVRSEAERCGLSPDFYEQIDLHVHIPVGVAADDTAAVGVAVATALVSLLTNRPAAEDVALTGELSLHGRILPVGRIREKVLTAYHAGIRRFILPAQNAQDLLALPEDIRANLSLTFVERIEQVLALALM